MLETDQCLMSSASVPDIFYDGDTAVTQFETENKRTSKFLKNVWGVYFRPNYLCFECLNVKNVWGFAQNQALSLFWIHNWGQCYPFRPPAAFSQAFNIWKSLQPSN